MLQAWIHSSKVLKAQSFPHLVLAGIIPFATFSTSSVDVANLQEDEVALSALLPFNDKESHLFFDGWVTLDSLHCSMSILVVNKNAHAQMHDHMHTLKQLKHGSFVYYRIYQFSLLDSSLKIAHSAFGLVRYFSWLNRNLILINLTIHSEPCFNHYLIIPYQHNK